jgi:PAS domain S-box-containing protein
LDPEKLDNKENKAKEKALEYEKQNYIKYLLDYSPDFQIILDGEGKIMRVNQAFEEITGKKKEELIGSFIYEFIPEEIIKKLRDKIIWDLYGRYHSAV